MNMPANVERNPRHAGEYIAYDAEGFAFRVYRKATIWRAFPSHAGMRSDARRFRANTLRAVAAMIASNVQTKGN